MSGKGIKAATLLLAVFLTAGMLMAGCQSTAAPTTAPSAAATTAASATSAPAAATATPAPQLAPYTIQWYMPNSVQPDQDAVNAAISKITQQKINATVQINFIDWGSYDQKMQVMMASQQDMDLIFTSNWGECDYISAVNKGAFLEVTKDMLNQYAPNVMSGVPELCWPAAYVNSKLYAIINTQVEGRTPGVILVKSFCDKYGLDPKSLKGLADLTPFFEKVHADNPSLYPYQQPGTYNDIAISYGIEVFSQTNPAAVYINDKTTKVMNYFAAPETKQFFELMHDWYQKGYIRQDAVTVKDDSADLKAGKYVGISTVINPDTLANQAVRENLKSADMVAGTFTKTFMNTGSIIATMTAISKTSKDPNRCLMLYNILYDKNDTTIFNMISYGIKDKHYTLNGDVVTPIANSGYSVACGWEYGCMFNSYRQSTDQPAWYPTGPDMNNSAIVSNLLGFNFNPDPVKTELAQCASVINEYYNPLITGSVDPDTTLPTFLAKLQNAGSDKIIAETQKQIDAWKATQK